MSAALCEECGGSGEVIVGHTHNPNSKIYPCEECEGTGIHCRECRDLDDGESCVECSMDEVETMYAE